MFLFYMTIKPEQLGAKIASKVGKELGIAPPKFEALAAPSPQWMASTGGTTWDMPKASKAFLMKSIFDHILKFTQRGLEQKPVAFVALQFAEPRAFELVVEVISAKRIGILCGTLVYSAKLSKPVASEITLGDPIGGSDLKFTGGNGTSDRLSRDAGVVSGIRTFVRSKYYPFRMANVSAQPSFKINPSNGGAILTIKTLPANFCMKMFAKYDAKSFLEVARVIEAAM